MAGNAGNWHKISGAVKARIYIPVSTVRALGIDLGGMSANQIVALASLMPQPSGQAKRTVDIDNGVGVADYQALAQNLLTMSGRLIGDANFMRYGTPEPNMISADARDEWDKYDSFSAEMRAKYETLMAQSRDLSQLAGKARQAMDAMTPKSPAQLAGIAAAKAKYDQNITAPLSAGMMSWAQRTFTTTDTNGNSQYTNADLIALRDSNLARVNTILSGNPSASSYADATTAYNTARAIDAILAQRD